MLPSILFALLQAADAAQKPVSAAPASEHRASESSVYVGKYLGASAITRQHDRLAVATDDGGVAVIDIRNGKITLVPPQSPEGVCDIEWKPDGSALAVRRGNGAVWIVDEAKRPAPAFITDAQNDTIQYAAGGTHLVVGIGLAGAEIWECEKAERIARFTTEPNRRVSRVCVSPDGEYVALGDDLGGVAAWKVRGGVRIPQDTAVPRGTRFHGVLSLAFDPSNSLLAIGSGVCRAYVWTVGSTSAPREFGHCEFDFAGDTAIGCVLFSPDGSRLLTASFAIWEARVWDVASGSLVGAIDYSGGNPGSIGAWFSSDGRYVTTSMGCLTARIVEPMNFPNPRSPPYSPVTWCSDGDYAWAVVDHHLVVRKVPDEEPVMRVSVREK